MNGPMFGLHKLQRPIERDASLPFSQAKQHETGLGDMYLACTQNNMQTCINMLGPSVQSKTDLEGLLHSSLHSKF